jgi:adenosylcobyric acid synthase
MDINNKSIMIQGTASTVGKSLLCTALCRIFTEDGYNVNPFKSQNMSLNSYITYEGKEMGRAQVMQAEAAGKAPDVRMNPILLKPTSDRKSQIILEGRVASNMDAVDYYKFKRQLRKRIGEIYDSLQRESDIVVIEGAGSPAEINLNKDDLVNMGMAKIAKSPVILVGDIDKGGVFASLAGTMLLLSEDERKLVKGVIINKFRGSFEILKPGLKMLEDIIKVPVLGVVPYFNLNLEDEDSVADWDKFSVNPEAEIDIAIIKLPYMSNFTDFNALRLYKDVNLRFVEAEDKLGNPDIIIIPGSKSTISDMNYLRESGFESKIRQCYSRGCYIFGICGGFQILGIEIIDSYGVETSHRSTRGLGLINGITEFKEEKITTLCEGEDNLFGCSIKGYEIHMGETRLLEESSSLVKIRQRNNCEISIEDGAASEDKRVIGTYIHGIFDNSRFTRRYLNEIRSAKGLKPIEEVPVDFWEYKEEQYSELAKIVRESLDMDAIYEIIQDGC